MDHLEIGGRILGAGAKLFPVAGFITVGHVTTGEVQAVAYGLAALCSALNMAHVHWTWSNEREDRRRERARAFGEHELPEPPDNGAG